MKGRGQFASSVSSSCLLALFELASPFSLGLLSQPFLFPLFNWVVGRWPRTHRSLVWCNYVRGIDLIHSAAAFYDGCSDTQTLGARRGLASARARLNISILGFPKTVEEQF